MNQIADVNQTSPNTYVTVRQTCHYLTDVIRSKFGQTSLCFPKIAVKSVGRTDHNHVIVLVLRLQINKVSVGILHRPDHPAYQHAEKQADHGSRQQCYDQNLVIVVAHHQPRLRNDGLSPFLKKEPYKGRAGLGALLSMSSM